MIQAKFKPFSKFLLIIITSLVAPCMCSLDTNITFDNRILYGERAEENQFPYQVSLQLDKKHICGGSIISDGKVLTAAHCSESKHGRSLPIDSLRVLVGTNQLKVSAQQYFYLVKSVVVHDKFDRETVHYDYALVFIKGTFDFRSLKISIIPLAQVNPLPGTVCYVSGWGDVDTDTNKVKIPNELQYARITVDPPKVCSAIYGNYFRAEYMLCVGKSNNENAGSGDSGGPLCCNSKLNGVVSYGKKYYDPKSPDVYSSVAFAFEWINATEYTGGSSRILKINFILILFAVLLAILV